VKNHLREKIMRNDTSKQKKKKIAEEILLSRYLQFASTFQINLATCLNKMSKYFLFGRNNGEKRKSSLAFMSTQHTNENPWKIFSFPHSLSSSFVVLLRSVVYLRRMAKLGISEPFQF
jgi:hypothetical protein